MKLSFDITALENKIFFAIISIMVFTLIYSFFTMDELGISEPNATIFDIAYVASVTQFSVYLPSLLKPRSKRVKICLLVQLFVTFCIVAA